MPLPMILILAYSVLMFVGGLIGYLKAGSKPSLIAGVISGILLAGSFFVAQNKLITGLCMAAVLAGLLSIVFLTRFLKTKSFMPSGMMLVISVAAAGYFAWTAAMG